MQTAHDIRMTFRRIHSIVIPAGTKVERAHGTGGWTVHPSRVRLESGTHSLFKHDSEYYFIWVDEKDLTP